MGGNQGTKTDRKQRSRSDCLKEVGSEKFRAVFPSVPRVARGAPEPPAVESARLIPVSENLRAVPDACLLASCRLKRGVPLPFDPLPSRGMEHPNTFGTGSRCEANGKARVRALLRSRQRLLEKCCRVAG